MKVNDAVFGVLLLALAAALLLHVRSFPTIPGQDFGPAIFPGLVAVGMAVCGALLVARGVRSRARLLAPRPWVRSRPHIVAICVAIGGILAYIALADWIGFLLLAPVLLFLLFVAFGRRAAVALPVALAVTAGMHYAFYTLLRVPLPWGVLTPWAW